MPRKIRYTIVFIALAIFTGAIYFLQPHPDPADEIIKAAERKMKGRKVTLTREMVIARKAPKLAYVLPYFMQEKGQSFYFVINELYSIPVGSIVTIEKIQPFTVHTPAQHGRPETDIEHVFVVCSVYSKQREDAIQFEYDLNDPMIKVKGYPWE